MNAFDNDKTYLIHFGTKGMKWGVRKYQNEDGSLTEAGKIRYGSENSRNTSDRKWSRDMNRIDREYSAAKGRSETYHQYAIDKRAREMHKMDKKGKEFSERAAKKIEKWEKTAADYDKLSKEGQKFVERIGQLANDSRRSITMRDVWQYSGSHYGSEKYVPGHHYKVKSDGEGKTKYRRTLNPNDRQYVTTYYYYF